MDRSIGLGTWIALAAAVLALLGFGASTTEQPVETFAFYLFAGVTLGGAVGVVLTTDLMRAAVALLISLLGAAGLYFLLAATFLAVVQLIVYTGGVLVLIVFGILLTHRGMRTDPQPPGRERYAVLLIVLMLAAALLPLLVSAPWPQVALGQGATSVAQIGRELLTRHLIAFELASVLLLAALLGAAHLARPERR